MEEAREAAREAPHDVAKAKAFKEIAKGAVDAAAVSLSLSSFFHSTLLPPIISVVIRSTLILLNACLVFNIGAPKKSFRRKSHEAHRPRHRIVLAPRLETRRRRTEAPDVGDHQGTHECLECGGKGGSRWCS